MELKENEFFISGNVPSTKNGVTCLCTGKGRGHLHPSKQVEAYLNSTKMKWLDGAKPFRDYVGKHKLKYPLHIEFQFIRDCKRSFDFIGPLETVQDCMSGKKFERSLNGLKLKNSPFAWIPDDSHEYLIPVIDPNILISKEGAGVIIRVLKGS